MHQSARIERTEDGFHTWIYHCTDYDALLAGLEKQGLSLPTADEWAYLCGGGCRTLFPWGAGLDYSMRLRWFEDMDEDENRPYDMEEPNFFGLSIAYDPYMREVVQAVSCLLYTSIQTIPAGTYPVKICVVPSEKYGDRYACVKVEVSREKPVRYELGMTGKEDLDEELGEDDYFGFGVDAGMGCVADIQTQAAFKAYWAKRLEEDPDIDPYNNLFCDLLEENAKAHPKYQGDCGDWLNWTVPGTDCNLPIFASGWGDGYYPVYFGYDAKGKICAVYVRFIDIEASYREQD